MLADLIPESGGPFVEVALILALATVLGAIGMKLRQPLLIMFLLTGIVSGPAILGIIGHHSEIELLAHIGIALLLFIVGLRLDIHLVRTTGLVSLATGLGQIVFTSIFGFGIAMALGMGTVEAAYTAVALTFSSTIIIVKLLSDKKEIDSLHGRIAIGFLIVQDIAAILALVVLTTLGQEGQAGSPALPRMISISARGAGFLAFTALAMRFILPGLTRRLARSQEMLVLFGISWAVLLSAASEILGFTKEVGAFVAGFSLASTEFRDPIGSRLSSLRDFLLLFFFIDLGARLDLSMVGPRLWPALLLSVFVLVGNPLVVMTIMGVMGYRRRTGFLAGLAVAQISEFSLILAALGVSLGQVEPGTMSLITLVGVITIFFSTYMILYSGRIYGWISRPLRIFEKKHPAREAASDALAESAGSGVDVVLLGLGNYGGGIAECLLERGMTMTGVDFDPAVPGRWQTLGVPVLYGDIGDPDLLERLPLDRAKWVVSTVRSVDLNRTLTGLLRYRGYRGRIGLAAASEDEAEVYRRLGVHAVLRPFDDAAEQAADSLTQAMDLLPEGIDWPISFDEVRLRAGSIHSGLRIEDIPLRAETGVSILAISRAGRVIYDPGPDFRLHPGDRVILMGPPEELARAGMLLNRHADRVDPEEPGGFALAELMASGGCALDGRTLAELEFKKSFGVTVIGIRRGDQRIESPGPGERIQPGDILVVIGARDSVSSLRCSLDGSAGEGGTPSREIT